MEAGMRQGKRRRRENGDLDNRRRMGRGGAKGKKGSLRMGMGGRRGGGKSLWRGRMREIGGMGICFNPSSPGNIGDGR